MSHTPGPWVVGNQDPLNFGKQRGNGTEPIGFVYGPSFPERSELGREALSNARLIAAAPELLEALRNMVEMFKDVPTLEQNSFDEPPEPKTQWDYEAYQMIGAARAAIAKAEGV